MTALDESPHRVVVGVVVVSALWLLAAHIGRMYGLMLVALVPFGVLTGAFVVRFVPEVRARLRVRLHLVLWGIAAAGVSLAATYVIYPILRDAYPPLQQEVRALYTLMSARPAHVIPILVVVAAEELLWRGALLMALRRDHVPAIAVTLAASLYAAAQLGTGSTVLALVALALGVFWSAIAALTRSLVPGLIAHACWTPMVMVFVPLER